MILSELDLFPWWAIIITGGSIFLALVSIYLYTDSRTRTNRRSQGARKKVRLLKSFVFVWVLLGLLIFYIISIRIGSALVFAVGNILVEILLIVYLLKNKTTSSEQT